MSRGFLFSSQPALIPPGCVFLCLPIKLSYNTGPSITSNFCCGERELRKLSTPPTIPISKKGNAKECSNYHIIALISHASKVMIKILQAMLQQYVNHELPSAQGGFGKARETRNQIANIHWIIKKAREFEKNIYFCFTDYAKDSDCVDHNKL